ncbi:MAG: HpaII family restriction endonuclease [Bacteroidetes bacterium]|nr:HpaII family restriction endonuclease [Bacteroidota bacterium]
MKNSPQTPNPLLSDQPYTFINLKAKTFAEYDIIYRINDCYAINQLSQINSNHQLLFQKFNNQIQQMNLVIVDSAFPIILADVALHVLTEEISTFEEYINARRFFVAVNPKYDRKYLTYKFKTFIHHLLFSNIASGNICKGEIEIDKVYCRKNDSSELEYYSTFQQFEMQEMMLEKMQLEINLKSSSLSNHIATLNLRIFLP